MLQQTPHRGTSRPLDVSPNSPETSETSPAIDAPQSDVLRLAPKTVGQVNQIHSPKCPNSLTVESTVAVIAPFPAIFRGWYPGIKIIKKEFKGIGEKGKGPRVGVTCPARICSWAWSERNCPGSAEDTAWFPRHAHRESIKGSQDGQKKAAPLAEMEIRAGFG